MSIKGWHLSPTPRRGNLKYLFHPEILDSQNTWEWLAPIKTSFSVPFSQSRVTCGRLLKAMFNNVLNTPKETMSTLFLGNLIHCLITCTEIKKITLIIPSRNAPFAYSFFSSLWAPLRRVWLHLLYFLPSSGSYRLIRFPLRFPFSGINPLSSLSLSWYAWCFKPSLNHLSDHLLDCIVCPHLYCTGKVTLAVSHQYWGIGYLAQPAANSSNAVQDGFSLLWHKGLWLANDHLIIYWDHQILLCKAAF